jgi:hypothetical protein
MTKLEAIVKVMKANGGKASWPTIYSQIGRYYKGAKASGEWQAGIRGVLYREMQNGRTFRKVGEGEFALK